MTLLQFFFGGGGINPFIPPLSTPLNSCNRFCISLSANLLAQKYCNGNGHRSNLRYWSKIAIFAPTSVGMLP